MKKYYAILGTIGVIALSVTAYYTRDVKPTTNTFAGFSDPFLSIQLATSPSNGNCLTTDGTNNSWSTCASGGGGGGGTFSTTTSPVSGQLFNYPNNATDIVLIGSNSTTSAEVFFDPNIQSYRIGSSLTASTTILGNATTTGSHSVGALMIGGDYLTELIGNGINLSSGALTCNTASASVFGCLTAAKFAEFDSATTTFGSGFATTTNGTALTFSTTTLSFNGLTSGMTIVPTAGALTFTPTLSGTLDNTGLTNSTISGISLGSNLNSLTNDATLNGSSYNGSSAISDWGLNLGNSNTWTVLQTFNYSSSTIYSSFLTASSTNLHIGTGQGIAYVGSNGKVGATATSTFSLSQFTNDLANLSATDATLTFSGNYNGSVARTVGLNLGNANSWTALQTFTNSTTTYGSFTYASSTLWYGGGLTGMSCTGASNKVTYASGTFRCEGDETGAGGTIDGTGVANTISTWVDNNTLTATSSHPLYVGSLFATSSSLISTLPRIISDYSSSTIYSSFNIASTTFLRIGLADGCLNISSGLVGTTGSACGSGGGSAFEIATTSDVAVPNLAYFTKASGMTTLGSVATTSLTLSGFPANIPSTYGKLVGGVDTTWTWWGLSTSSPITSGGAVIYATGANTVASIATSTPSVTSPITYSGTLGNFVGGVSGSFGCATCALTGTTITVNGTTNQITSSAGAQDLSANRTWTLSLPSYVLFPGQASTTGLSAGFAYIGSSATTTISSAGNVSLPAAGTLTVPALTSALTLTDGSGVFGEYGGAGCTNQVVEDISAVGGTTCVSINNGYWSGTDLTVANGGTNASSFAINSIVTSNGAGDTLIATSSHPLYVGAITATSSTVVSTFTGGTLTLASSTIVGHATTTGTQGIGRLWMNSDYITDFTGTDLSLSSGALTVDTLPNLTGTLDIDSGGTNSTTYPNNVLMFYNGSSILSTSSAPLYVSSLFSTSTVLTNTILNPYNLIGTTTGAYLLTIASSTAPQISLSAGTGVAQWVMRNAGGNFYLATTSVVGTSTSSPAAFTINNSGYGVFLGATTTNSAVTGVGIAGVSFWSGLNTSTAGNAICILTTNEIVTAGGTTCVTSSLKTKHNILNIENALDKVLDLRPVSYTYNESGETRYGFIAEEVEKVDSLLVEYAKKDIILSDGQVIKKGEPVSVDYLRYTGLITKAVQELDSKVNLAYILIGILFLWNIKLTLKLKKK